MSPKLTFPFRCFHFPNVGPPCLQTLWKPGGQESSERDSRMGRKAQAVVRGATASVEWDPEQKEPWHLDFEKEPVNDEKWSCAVSAAIPSEAPDDESIQSYSQYMAKGLRKTVKIISMGDVVKLLRGSTSVSESQVVKQKKPKAGKPEKVEISDKRDSLQPGPRPNQIVGLAARHAIFTDAECKLPPDLLAAVLKYLILNLKDQSRVRKRVDAVREKKVRERALKEKFIRSLKPFEPRPEGSDTRRDESQDFPDIDQPLDGPDLYVLLTDFYDVLCYPELLRLGVPFLSLIKISLPREKEAGTASPTAPPNRPASKKSLQIHEFWQNLTRFSSDPDETDKFKHIAMLSLHCPSPKTTSNSDIFNEMTWMQYWVYKIYRHHQSYRRELFVQRLVMALEPLDLAECEVYNAICDVLVTGGPLTYALVLHAMIEQVVAGVPETEAVVLDCEPDVPNYFGGGPAAAVVAKDNSRPFHKKPMKLVTPCIQCRGKVPEDICSKLKELPHDHTPVVKTDGTEISDSRSQSRNEEISLAAAHGSSGSKAPPSKESTVWKHLNEILTARRAERNPGKHKKWKAPELCSHGDQAFLELYHADPRILTAETLINRFLKPAVEKQVWACYPELATEDRAFFDFQFSSLQKLSQESEESLKLKLYFTISVKLISTMKSYVFRGEESEESKSAFSYKMKSSKMELLQESGVSQPECKSYSECLAKARKGKNTQRKNEAAEYNDKNGITNSAFNLNGFGDLRKTLGTFNLTVFFHRSSGLFLPLCRKLNDSTTSPSSSCSTSSNDAEALTNLLFMLDRSEITTINEESYISNKEEQQQLVQSFAFYENLQPHVMTQRLLEAKETFNTTQYLYFAPTDTMVTLMTNDCDFRGVFYTRGTGVLATPVCFRDFYTFVYLKISDWLSEEEDRYMEFVWEEQGRVQDEMERRDEEYLKALKEEYCGLSPEEREEYLETVVDVHSEPEVAEEELEDLPVKPKYRPPERVSFVATNLTEIQVQTETVVHEYHSRDGTEVNVLIDSWLYHSERLLKLLVKKNNLHVYRHQWLDKEEVNTSFTLKTASDLILSFFKETNQEEEDFNYRVNISWPTGLLVTPVFSDSGLYIRQGYMKACRSVWEVGEKSRCFLRNGEVLVMKENGDMEILCGSGTKYVFYESVSVPGYEIITPTGPIWEVKTEGACRFRKKLRASQKVFIGTDPKMQEIYYRREDGVSCMLWPNGKLITTYPDGTKITSTPHFGEEVTTEWSDEERAYFLQLESKNKLERGVSEFRSRTILRNPSTPRMTESVSFKVESFLAISCSYLSEHPKYSTVFFDPEEPHVRLTMPEELTVLVYPEGNYEVRHKMELLIVQNSTIKLCTICDDCDKTSTVTIDFKDEKKICQIIDFFKKVFVVDREGQISQVKDEELQDDIHTEDSEKNQNVETTSSDASEKCLHKHFPKAANVQRCFAVRRDMSGLEFIHADSLARDCHKLPEDTFYDLSSGDPPFLRHTFSSPYYRIGYENWVMDYEENDDCLPTNLNRKDLKELGSKDNPVRLFKYPFPKCSDLHQPSTTRKRVDMPKVTITRTVNCISPQPQSVIRTVHTCIEAYQKRAHDIQGMLSNFRDRSQHFHEFKPIKTRLKNIARVLSQNLKMYPHLCTQLPSTEKDIHYFGHFMHLMEEFKTHAKWDGVLLPDCKNVPQPLPRLSAFPSITEENESAS